MTASPDSPEERRRHARQVIVRPCKIRDRRTLLYAPGHTTDISVGGALIRVERARPFAAGDEVELVVAWATDAVLPTREMVRGTVKRVHPIDHRYQAVAIEFAASQQAQRPVERPVAA